MMDTLDVPGARSSSKGSKLGLKIEILRGSIAQLDPGEGTPTFKIKYPQSKFFI